MKENVSYKIQKQSLICMILIPLVLGFSACSSHHSGSTVPSSLTQSKASSLLLLQISLRKEQITSPTPERLAQMEAQGMNTKSLDIQRIYIYLKQPLNPDQAAELQALRIIVYSNSWIPPAGNNPDGFYLADMPVDQLDALAAKKFVIRLDTAEKLLQPQSNLPEGG